jgi:hypothetical protein
MIYNGYIYKKTKVNELYDKLVLNLKIETEIKKPSNIMY